MTHLVTVAEYTFRFYKDTDSRWYVDIPDFPGTKAELEMVEGADTMLAVMSQGEDDVWLTMSDKYIKPTPMVKMLDGSEPDMSKYNYPEPTMLTKIQDTPEIGGATYTFDKWNGIEYNYPIWLCEVTEYVFGYLPEVIYVY